MKFLNLLMVSVFILGFTTSGQGAEPADAVIKNALADIERFEQQASGLTPARNSSAKRILKLMNLSLERLNGSTNQDDPSWKEVNQRYVVLESRLEGLLHPASAQAAAPAKPAVEPAQVARGSAGPSTGSVPDLVSGQRVQVKKLIKDIGNVKGSLIVTGPSTLQAPNEIAARQKRLKQFEAALARYPQVEDPDVKAAQTAYDAYRQMLSTEFKRAQEQLKVLGDVQQRLATIEQNAQKYAVPQLLLPPFGEADAKSWVEAGSAARTVAEHNLKQLAEIAPLAYLPNNPGTPQTGSPYDAGDVNRLAQNADGMLSKLQQGYEGMAEGLMNQLNQIESDVLGRWQEDPNSDKRWMFIREGQEQEAFKLYEDSLAIANSSVYLEKSLGREAKPAESLIAKIENAKKEFIRKRDIALNTSKMPEPASKDKEMLKIAKDIVENPKYEFGEHGKIVLTTDEIVERERKDSEIDIDDVDVSLGGDLKMSGTETTWTYKWKEFKFAVSLKEKESDTWHIWWITAKNFSSGGTNTPINKWISGSTTKGNPILKKNL